MPSTSTCLVCFCFELLRLKQYFWYCFCLHETRALSFSAAQMKPDADGNTPAIMVPALSFHARLTSSCQMLPVANFQNFWKWITYSTFPQKQNVAPRRAVEVISNFPIGCRKPHPTEKKKNERLLHRLKGEIRLNRTLGFRFRLRHFPF